MNKIKKVLIVGGSGYIGAGVVSSLVEKNIPFTVYDDLLYEYQYLRPVDFIRGDIRDTEKLGKILPNYSHVIWLAAIVGDAACQIKPSLTISVNQEPLKWLSENFDGRVIFTSTCSVYGKNQEISKEDSLVNPLSLYAQTKLQAEKYLEKQKNHLIFRLGTAYGISNTYSRLRMDLVVNYMTASALIKGSLQVFGGDQQRPLIHVKDIGSVIVDNLNSNIQGVYNLATVNMNIKDLAGIVKDETRCEIEYVERKFEDERNYYASCEKAKRDGVFDFKNFKDIKFGVKEISDVIKSGRVKYAEKDIYFNEKHLNNLLKKGEYV